MAIHLETTFPAETQITPSDDDWVEWGWRTIPVRLADGTEDFERVLLTPEDFLHPEEGDTMPISTSHAQITGEAKAILEGRYAADANTGVFTDLIVDWEDRILKHHCPDVCVIFGIRNKNKNRRRFFVKKEGARPSLIIEVVSPRYRREDRVRKLKAYEQAGVQEYVIIDQWEQGNETADEIIGYRLVNGRYRPIPPDEQDRLLCQTVGLWLSMQNGRIVMEDAKTGERLLSPLEMKAAREAAEIRTGEQQAARQAAEVRAREEQAARQAAELEVTTLRSQLAALQEELSRRSNS
jgi:Uma2 family endonuclease